MIKDLKETVDKIQKNQEIMIELIKKLIELEQNSTYKQDHSKNKIKT